MTPREPSPDLEYRCTRCRKPGARFWVCEECASSSSDSAIAVAVLTAGERLLGDEEFNRIAREARLAGQDATLAVARALAAPSAQAGDRPATKLTPTLLVAWLELLADRSPPATSIDWQMVGRDALKIVRWALASGNDGKGET